MNLNGSSGERYSIDKKKRYTGSNYTDYQIVGSGGYVARIFSRGQRKPAIERELLDAAKSGAYYGEERPLNVLYSHNNFVGFLYEGEVMTGVRETAGMENEADSGSYVAAGHNDQTVFTWAVQISALIIAAAIGIFAVKGWRGFLFGVGWNRSGCEYSGNCGIYCFVQLNTIYRAGSHSVYYALSGDHPINGGGILVAEKEIIWIIMIASEEDR